MGAFDGLSRALRPDGEGDTAPVPKRPNPIAHAMEVTRFRSRGMSDDLVESRARRLHSMASYDRWEDLDDVDQQLWRHMARIQISQGVPAR